MKEIEVKILEINKEEIIKKLENLGAKKILDSDVDVLRFDFEDMSLSKQNKKLRLRKKGEICELTFKEILSKEEAKVADEFEIKVNSFEETEELLKKLGLKQILQYTKHRISYVIDNVRFEIDSFKEIPTFLEIEAPNLEKIKEFVKKLGFSMKDTKPWSRSDVFKHYGKL